MGPGENRPLRRRGRRVSSGRRRSHAHRNHTPGTAAAVTSSADLFCHNGLVHAVLLLAALLAAPRPDPRLREYCSLVRGCALPAGAAACPAEASAGVEGVRYDERRCEVPRTLIA